MPLFPASSIVLTDPVLLASETITTAGAGTYVVNLLPAVRGINYRLISMSNAVVLLSAAANARIEITQNLVLRRLYYVIGSATGIFNQPDISINVITDENTPVVMTLVQIVAGTYSFTCVMRYQKYIVAGVPGGL